MNDPIMLTPYDIWKIVLAVCGAIITISAAVTIVVKMIDKAKEPNKEQDRRITALEKSVEEITKRLELGNKRFEADSTRADNIEQAMRRSNKVIIESLQALTAHAIDGNNIQELKDAKKSLDEYLLSR